MRLLHASLHRVNHRARNSAEPYAARGVGGISQQRRPLSAEGLLLGLVDGKSATRSVMSKRRRRRESEQTSARRPPAARTRLPERWSTLSRSASAASRAPRSTTTFVWPRRSARSTPRRTPRIPPCSAQRMRTAVSASALLTSITWTRFPACHGSKHRESAVSEGPIVVTARPGRAEARPWSSSSDRGCSDSSPPRRAGRACAREALAVAAQSASPTGRDVLARELRRGPGLPAPRAPC